MAWADLVEALEQAEAAEGAEGAAGGSEAIGGAAKGDAASAGAAGAPEAEADEVLLDVDARISRELLAAAGMLSAAVLGSNVLERLGQPRKPAELSQHTEGTLLLRGGRVVGFVVAGWRDGARSIAVKHIAVNPSWRFQGIGRKLVAHVARRATRLPHDRITAAVDGSNAAAMGFFHALGFSAGASDAAYYNSLHTDVAVKVVHMSAASGAPLESSPQRLPLQAASLCGSVLLPVPLPNARFGPGMIIEALSTILVRSEESPTSPAVTTLLPGAVVEVLAVGAEPSGLLIGVRDAEGREGWASVVSKAGAWLWCKVKASEKSFGRGAACSIRPFQPDDRPALEALEQECFKKGEQQLERRLKSAAQPSESTFVDVAVAPDGTIVAYVAWTLEVAPTPGSNGRLGPVVYVQSLAVSPRRRGMRIGEQMLRRVAENGEARFPSAAFLVLHVRSDNRPAHRLYGRFGFMLAAVIRGYYADRSGWEMVCELGPAQLRPVDPSSVRQLVEAGFESTRAERALRLAQNDLQGAVALLKGSVPKLKAVKAPALPGPTSGSSPIRPLIPCR